MSGARPISMPILKLAVVMLVATTSIVTADAPREERSERTSYRGTKRHVVPVGEWFSVADATPPTHGREFIPIDPENSRLARLRLATAVGRLEVRTVRVDYTDGTQQLIRLDKQIKVGKPAIIELEGTKTVRQLVVTTELWGKGAYTVEAVTAAEPTVGT